MQNAFRFGILTATLWTAFLISPSVLLAQSGSAGGTIGNDEKSLSGSRDVRPERPARNSSEETHRSRPSGGGGGGGGRGNFDGPWAFTSAGCSGAGTTVTLISGGRFVTQFSSGSVSPNGSIRSVGAGNGLSFTASGRLVGNSGAGTFKRSDGCNGTWTGIRQ
jgi:hypothetical protein